MDRVWLLEQLTPERPGFWLALSVGLAVLIAAAAGRFAPGLAAWLRPLRWVLVPYGGLVLGGLSPRLLGLTQLDWAATFGIGTALLFAVAVLLLLIRIPLQGSALAGGESGDGLGVLIFASGARSFHWCFLRGALWDLLLALPAPPELPLYWAVWLGAALALPGVATQPGQLPQKLTALLALIVTTVVFLYTRNFWLCWLVHGLIAVGLSPAQPFPSRAAWLGTQRSSGDKSGQRPDL